MASRMLHYLIATKIADEARINNVKLFLLGALLPDASTHNDGSYNRAHFWDYKLEEKIKGIDWCTFKQKYEKDIANNSLYQGYLCHLIMDAIWFNTIVDKYVRIYPKNERDIYYKRGYGDYLKLNYILPVKYKIECVNFQIPDISIEEMNLTLVPALIEALKNDFCISEELGVDDLSLYPYDAIEQYILESIEVCVAEISTLGKKENFKVPVDYYVKLRNE